jgi:glycosyltransferase involved in cell wall biosynthesis
MNAGGQVGIVMIGRNEGERLARCLASTRAFAHRVYVDSGSTDGSVALAKSEGAIVIELPVPPKFTAARARNAGIEALLLTSPRLTFIQAVDGDCEVQPGWIEAGLAALEKDSGLGAVFGRRRERFPDRSIYNALCDDEWNVPVGQALCFGGDVLFRVEAIHAATGYDDTMIAGEDPDFSTRVRKAGWHIERIDAEMTMHDAAMLRFKQWWNRTRRAGHAFAELANRHPDVLETGWRRSCRSIILWGGLMPAALLASIPLAVLLPYAWILTLLMLLLWPLKIVQIALRQRRRLASFKLALASGAFLMIGKLPELLGLLEYRRNRKSGRSSTLIEYKGAEPA